MFLVWSIVFWKTGSFRKSTIAALVTGKSFAVVYKLAGLDRVVYTLYIIHRRTGLVKEIHVTMVEVLLLSFLASLLVALYWPILSRYAPRELRSAMEPG
ncbi:hypothetical protein PABY_08220 [Pyrodictium abyssi]|uniref:Uncharacterized protein n=1 Tax=Pyrodictium abyssi TaxID=54256 RepID=A0ABN6ZLV3_9CREN|nr:hypothetical protein PABY_08220 [Pyrodictium abyssi]